MKIICGKHRQIHFGGSEFHNVLCTRRQFHGGKHRITWTAGMGAKRWKIKVTWR